MKRFSFPLEKVLSFRRRQLDLAESNLKRTLQQESILASHAVALEDEALACRGAATGREETDGAALRLTGEYVEALDERRTLTLEAKRKLEGQRRQQMARLVEVRRYVKLLEKLRAKRLRIHQRDLDRQIEAETAELHLAKWGRGGS